MANQRGVVTVIRQYGDSELSTAIITGVVSKEVKRIQAENHFTAKRLSAFNKAYLDDFKRKCVIKPSKGLVKFVEQVLGLYVMFRDERRQNNASH